VKPTIVWETGPTQTNLGVEADAVSGYLTRLFGNDGKDLGQVVADSWLDEARKNNRRALRRRTDEILRERKVEGAAPLSPNLAIEILKFAQDEGRPVLIELWARLLAGAVDPSRRNLRLSFIETVKRMDPPDAMLIERLVHRGYRVIRDEDGPASFNDATISLLTKELNLSPDAVFVSLEHLEELRILTNASSDLLWRTTSFGREFFRACYRYR
jgi:hypothetical protein